MASATGPRSDPRSLPVYEWPDADRRAWEAACRPGSRLKPGGSASYLAQVSRDDFANRYGAFLGFLQRSGRLDRDAAAAAQVTPANVEAYISDLTARVRSVTVWNAIYKLRRAAELIAPKADFSWLAEIEKDLALVMEPRSKFDRLVFTGPLVKAGLTLMTEAQGLASKELICARAMRNGLIVALLAMCPIRLKNFAALEIGHTFKQVLGNWWIALPSVTTKSRRPDERRVPKLLDPWIEIYLRHSRAVLLHDGARDRCPVDFLHNRQTDDQKESRYLGVQNHASDFGRRCLAAPVSYRRGFNRGRLWGEYAPPCQRFAQSHRSACNRGALQSRKQHQRCKSLRRDRGSVPAPRMNPKSFEIDP